MLEEDFFFIEKGTNEEPIVLYHNNHSIRLWKNNPTVKGKNTACYRCEDEIPKNILTQIKLLLT